MTDDIFEIDGSYGEGGGQIVRSSLTLAMATGRAVRVTNIRAGRSKPGLLRQHLACVHAARDVSQGTVAGDTLGSREVTLWPGAVRPGTYELAVATAGSACLVLQTVLPVLATADGPTTLSLRGGTHNPAAPSFDFLQRAFFPLLSRMGVDVVGELSRPGFYPAGGGRATVRVRPGAGPLEPIELCRRGDIVRRRVEARVSALPLRIARAEVDAFSAALGWHRDADADADADSDPAALPTGKSDASAVTPSAACERAAVAIDEPRGPGNVLVVDVASEHVTEVFTGFGERGVRAQAVARRLAKEVGAYLAADVPVGPHLADQLLLWLGLAGAGAFRTVEPTLHTRTHADLIERFLPVRVTLDEQAGGAWLARVVPRGGGGRGRRS